jgi:hypothetical protein
VRRKERGSFERATVNAILDEAFFCHVGFSVGGQPFVQPTIHARLGELLYLHGSNANRMLKALASGTAACVTVTLLDGLVLARSAFHHSMNYRSVMILGSAREVSEPAEKRRALKAVVEHVMAGRAAAVRAPSVPELNATMVLALPITEASAKIRTGPPLDAEEDYALQCWAGVLPLRLAALPPLPDPRLRPRIAPPRELTSWSRGGAQQR